MNNSMEINVKKKVYRILIFLFGTSFIVFLLLIVQTWIEEENEKKLFYELSQIVEIEEKHPVNIDGKVENKIVQDEKHNSYNQLKEKNVDFFAWLLIPGTRINYPVMSTPDDPEYYLRRNYNKENFRSGTPFLGKYSRLESDNIIIYGHNMQNGTMFSDLILYQDEEFWKAHKCIFMLTEAGTFEYEIIAAFSERVHYKNETSVFRYYNYEGTLTEEEYKHYVSNIKKLTPYNMNSFVNYGQQLITLSTCSNHEEHGRYVVVARRI